MSNCAESLISLLKKHNITMATAESCTGGMIGQMLTSISGASSVYMGGIISYSNEVKMKLLGVKEETLRLHGAVSREIAEQMAEGARLATDADVAVSVTGIAGPAGGTADKPVGTVCFGVSTKHGTLSYRQQFGEDKSRDEIRRLAAEFACTLAESAIYTLVLNS